MKNIILFISFLIAFTAVDAQVRVERSSKMVSIEGYRYYSHTVVKKQTLYSIAKAYNVSEEIIIELNPQLKWGLKAKQDIIIPTKTAYQYLLQKKAVAQIEEKLNNSTNESLNLPVAPSIKDTISIAIDTIIVKDSIIRTGLTRDFDKKGTIKVAMLLPFKDPTSAANRSYVEFLNGSLIALDELKKEGVSVDLKLISFGDWDITSENSTEEDAIQIIESGQLNDINLLIGPVLPKDLKPFADWATENRIPLVSPISQIGDIESPFVFQAAPDEDIKFDKLKPILQNSNTNIVVMRTAQHTDENYFEGIMELLPKDTYVMQNTDPNSIRTLGGTLEVGKENVIILPVTNETTVSTILEKIELLNSGSKYKITVIGLARWARFTSINVGTLFKLNTIYIANYHEDRNEPVMHNFYAKYISGFMNIPSVFSMRGYDITKIFISSLSEWGSAMPMKIHDFDKNLLQVNYRFEQNSDASTFKNKEWILVNYSPEYRIIIK